MIVDLADSMHDKISRSWARIRLTYSSFTAKADITPFKHLPAQVDLNEVNKPDAYGAKLSATFDFSREDAADDLLLNEVVWRSVRGANSPMPAPVRAGFVFVSLEEEEEEEEE